nr:reverse transcriptase domain-containing protein [Tanacetum cinerariifolium]
MPWKTLMMMTDKYCPKGEIKKLEIEIWNLKVKGTDVESYTQCFQELALLCGRMFPEEYDKVEKYVDGLPDMIQGSLMDSKPNAMKEAIEIANYLMDQKVRAMLRGKLKTRVNLITKTKLNSNFSREDLALYDNKSWNDPRDFTKLVKAISLPQDVLSTSNRRLIKLENQVQRLMEAHLAPMQPTQVNKITSSCEIFSGPRDTQYCMENPKQAFVEYASPCTDEVGGDDVDVMFIEIVKKDDDSCKEELEAGGLEEEPSIYTAPVPHADDPYIMVRDAAMDTQGDEDVNTDVP